VHAAALPRTSSWIVGVGHNCWYVSERTEDLEYSCYWIGQAGGARFVRRISPKPTTYLTGEYLYQIAAIKFEEAAATPEGSARQQTLNSAYNFRDLAKVKGWPPTDIKPPE
jgi:hypothetical protein